MEDNKDTTIMTSTNTDAGTGTIVNNTEAITNVVAKNNETIITADAKVDTATNSIRALVVDRQKNKYLTQFDNGIQKAWIDLHSNATIFDEFKMQAGKETVEAVVFSRIQPIDFDYNTDQSALTGGEAMFGRPKPDIARLLVQMNLQKRFKTSSSAYELMNITDDIQVGANAVVTQLGASYADYMTEQFIGLIDGLKTSKNGNTVNAMATTEDMSSFIQNLNVMAYNFMLKRDPKYNAIAAADSATACTKVQTQDQLICFIDPTKFEKISADFYATLYNIEQASTGIKFVKLPFSNTDKRFAVLCDKRAIAFYERYYEIRTEQIPEREAGDFTHVLFNKDILGEFTGFNRQIYTLA